MKNIIASTAHVHRHRDILFGLLIHVPDIECPWMDHWSGKHPDWLVDDYTLAECAEINCNPKHARTCPKLQKIETMRTLEGLKTMIICDPNKPIA